MSTILATATVFQSIERRDADLLNSGHVVATFVTRNSHYTLVKRSGFVVLVKDRDRDSNLRHPIGVGTVITGKTSMVEAVYGGEWTRFVLRIWNAEGDMVFMSSYIESAYVLEN